MREFLVLTTCAALVALPGTADASYTSDVGTGYSTTSNTATDTWSYRAGTPGNRNSGTLLPDFTSDLIDPGGWLPAGPTEGGWGDTDGSVWNHPYFIANDWHSPSRWYNTVPPLVPAGQTFGNTASTEDLVISWLAPSAD